MAQLLSINAGNIIGGPAMVWLAPATYSMPQKIADILSLSTYAPNATYGFLPIGATEVGVTFSREVTVKQWRTDQQGLLKTQPLDYKSVITTKAMETTQTNKVRLQQASIGALDAGTPAELVTYFEASPFLTVWRVAIINQSDDLKFHARVFGHCQWDGKAQKEMFERGAPDAVDFSFDAFPTTDCVGPNGFSSDRLDFDQP